MQSEEPTIIQSLENHLAEYGHTTVGQDIAAAILVIKDLHQKAALSAAEPVAELQSVDARELDEAIKLLPSVMRPSLSKVIISAIEEQRRIISYFKRTSNARQLAFDAALSAQVQDVAGWSERVQQRISVYRDMRPEDDESWESWYFAAFDLLSAEVTALPAAPANKDG